MAIVFETPGSLAYSASGGATVAPPYPANLGAGDLVVLLVGQKPSTANSGGVTTPAGWSVGPAMGAGTSGGGYGTTLGMDTGNTNLFSYYVNASSSWSGTNLSVGLSANGVSWAQMLRLSGSTAWDVDGATGRDISGGTGVSVAFGTNPGVCGRDYIIGAFCIPTDVSTPSQFSNVAFSQAGVEFGVDAEVSEPDTSTGNDIGGMICRAPIASGLSTANPTMTATAGGTTTNVRGPALFIRVRESVKEYVPAVQDIEVAGSATYSFEAGEVQSVTHDYPVVPDALLLSGFGTASHLNVRPYLPAGGVRLAAGATQSRTKAPVPAVSHSRVSGAFSASRVKCPATVRQDARLSGTAATSAIGGAIVRTYEPIAQFLLAAGLAALSFINVGLVQASPLRSAGVATVSRSVVRTGVPVPADLHAIGIGTVSHLSVKPYSATGGVRVGGAAEAAQTTMAEPVVRAYVGSGGLVVSGCVVDPIVYVYEPILADVRLAGEATTTHPVAGTAVSYSYSPSGGVVMSGTWWSWGAVVELGNWEWLA